MNGPGVYFQERDLSAYTPQVGTSVLGLAGTASKGPVGVLTLITSEGQLIDTFGLPYSGDGDDLVLHYGLLAAIRYLRYGNQLQFIRVADGSEAATGTIAGLDSTEPTPVAANTTVTAASDGTWGNSIKVKVEDSTYYADKYKISILYNDVVAEVYDNLAIAGDDWIDKINAVSRYVQIGAAGAGLATLTPGTVSLSGGDDGVDEIEAADYIGTEASPPDGATGLKAFYNDEAVVIDMIACPVNDPDAAGPIADELEAIADSRQDCVAIIDPPSGLSVAEVVGWHNGIGSDTPPSATLTSNYAAVYYPWVQVLDSYSKSLIFVPPSGHVAGALARTDATHEPWFATAGAQRGILPDVRALEYSPTRGEREFLSSNGSSVNPIVNIQGQGIMIYGQRTCQRTNTALDRLNVRRLCNYIKRVSGDAARSLLWEPNDPVSWDNFARILDTRMASIKARRGVYDYYVICDSTTNTPDVVNANEMRASIVIQPTKAIERITIVLSVSAFGAAFESIT